MVVTLKGISEPTLVKPKWVCYWNSLFTSKGCLQQNIYPTATLNLFWLNQSWFKNAYFRSNSQGFQELLVLNVIWWKEMPKPPLTVYYRMFIWRASGKNYSAKQIQVALKIPKLFPTGTVGRRPLFNKAQLMSLNRICQLILDIKKRKCCKQTHFTSFITFENDQTKTCADESLELTKKCWMLTRLVGHFLGVFKLVWRLILN